LAIISGQASMVIYVRKIPSPFNFLKLVEYSVTAWSFYGIFVCYGLGFAAYILLLRFFPLAEVSVSVLVVTVLAAVIYTFLLGQSITLLQILGVVFVIIGFILLQIK
jgi:drug/metabolite transporter (DMT)-like permease